MNVTSVTTRNRAGNGQNQLKDSCSRAIESAISSRCIDNRRMQTLAFISLTSLAVLLAYAREWGCDRRAYQMAWAGAALTALWLGFLI